MKAEHRKELETNILADRLGTAIQKMKGGPRRRTVVYVFLAVLAIIALYVGYRVWRGDPRQTMYKWIAIDEGEVDKLFREPANTSTRKVARLQIAHIYLDSGIKMMGAKPEEALNLIDLAEYFYTQTKEDVKGDADKAWLAETEYSLAVIEEARTAVDPASLTKAKNKYQEVAKEYETTAHGALAKQRAADLSDTKKFNEVAAFYRELDKNCNIAEAEKQRKVKAEKERAIIKEKGGEKGGAK